MSSGLAPLGETPEAHNAASRKMSSAFMPAGEAKPRISRAAGLACFTSPLSPKTSTPEDRLESTAWLKFSVVRARRCSAWVCSWSSCFCCLSCWITVL